MALRAAALGLLSSATVVNLHLRPSKHLHNRLQNSFLYYESSTKACHQCNPNNHCFHICGSHRMAVLNNLIEQDHRFNKSALGG
jgi:hypothetical protein